MWKKLELTDIGGIKRYMAGLGGQRDHYKTRTFQDIKKYMARKTDFESWLWEDEDYAMGATLCYRPKVLDGEGCYCLMNAWYEGDIEWETAIEHIIEIIKGYCQRHDAKTLYHIQNLDLKGQSSELMVKKPFAKDRNIVKFEDHFKSVGIEKRDGTLHFTITV